MDCPSCPLGRRFVSPRKARRGPLHLVRRASYLTSSALEPSSSSPPPDASEPEQQRTARESARHRGPGEDLPDRGRGAQGRRSRDRGGRVLRPARPQRRRQVDPDPLHDRARAADRGRDPGLRPRRGRRLRRGAPGGRAGAAGAQPRLVPDPRGDARLPRRLLRDAEEGAPRARRRAARDLLAVRQAQGAHADALGRDEAPADPRAGADAPPAAADPRRADRRGRHRAAARALALREADQRRGHDDPAHHSLPRGGRAALRPDRLHQRGQHRRPGLLGELATRYGVANLEDAYLELVGRKELSRSKVEEEFV